MGHMTLHNHSGATITTSTGKKTITGLTAIDSNNVTISGSAGTITIRVDGVYYIDASLSYSGNNGDEFHTHIAVDGTDTESGHFRGMTTTSKGFAGASRRQFLSAGSVITVTTEETGDTRDMTLYYCDFGVHRIG